MTVKALKKQLMAAIAMVVVSAIALSSSTYAWFSMNTQVTATGMTVQAKAESGLVISNADDGSYNNSATSVKTTCAQLVPGSTTNLGDWFHSSSTNPAAANTQQAYDVGSAWVNNETVANYVVHDFYIRSSATTDLTVPALRVQKVEAKVGDAAAQQNLSKALRVGVLIAGDETDNKQNIYIYAPVSGATLSYSATAADGAYAAGNMVTVTALEGNTASATAITTIPAKNANSGLHAQVFVWYEGEDAACISNNIPTKVLEQLTVTVTFDYVPAS
ncbi:MAG: hypothetical protein IJ747_09140 [Lachnospiraceae bacterium]|nr:hypothetical protein [Lachnospiraceae bacterium]